MKFMNELRPNKSNPTLMTQQEKATIKGVIKEILLRDQYPDSVILGRQFNRLPTTIRKLVTEVKSEEQVPETYTDMSYETLWGILGCMRQGAHSADICTKFKCTVDDIKRIGDDYDQPWAETAKVRNALMKEVGIKEWRAEAMKRAQWQPEAAVV